MAGVFTPIRDGEVRLVCEPNPGAMAERRLCFCRRIRCGKGFPECACMGGKLDWESRGVFEGMEVYMSGGLVSVIVPMKNSAEVIEMCLRLIREQIHPYIEITVVDNYSKDRTAEVAKE